MKVKAKQKALHLPRQCGVMMMGRPSVMNVNVIQSKDTIYLLFKYNEGVHEGWVYRKSKVSTSSQKVSQKVKLSALSRRCGSLREWQRCINTASSY